jgi:WD40 repeat protein/transcriptional regulator with XRE-family HTH domain
VDTSQPTQAFRDLLLRHRGRTGLTQHQLAERVGVHWRSIQDWENGAKFPGAERLAALVRVLLETRGLTAGREAAEAQALWAAVESAAPRARAPFDTSWFASLMAERPSPLGLAAPARDSIAARLIARAAGAELPERSQDWGDAPDLLGFIGRSNELETLAGWVLDERGRLLAILGMGGIGKTSFAARLAHEVAPGFERLYWRSLRDVPPIGEWLGGAIGFLSDQHLVPPTTESDRLALLVELLRERRCLLVLDNFPTVLEQQAAEGRYHVGSEAYAHLVRAVGAATHQSCVVLTSREAPSELTILRSEAVRSFLLAGLRTEEVQVLLAANQLIGTHEQWAELRARFGGNGLALKVVGETIRELFGGDLGSFLAEPGASSVFGDIRRVLSEQIEHSSAAEQRVLRTLALEREPMGVPMLLEGVGPRVNRGAVLTALEALRRRSLVERAEVARAATFTLQPVVLQYVTDRLVETVVQEIDCGHPSELLKLPLIKAQAKEYVRQTQERLIGAAVVQGLNAQHGPEGTERRLLALLDAWRGRPPEQQGYGPGSVVNLLRLLRGDLRALDLSRLTLRQAYLAEVEAQDATMAGTRLSETVLAGAFDFPTTVGLTRDGTLLVAGTSTGEVRLWRVADRTPLWAVPGHTGAVWDVALSADGLLLASSSEDGTVRLWETGTGQPVATLTGHAVAVWDVALSADGELLASGGGDGAVRLWETGSRRLLANLTGHTGAVHGLALSADGQRLASGSVDSTVRLWDTRTGNSVGILQGHSGPVWSVALSADGQLLASGGVDGTVRLWGPAGSGQPLATLLGHTGTVYRVALSADGQLLASGAGDGTVRLWDTGSARALAILPDHTGAVRGVALSASGQLVASSSYDGTVRLWETGSGQALATLQGHTGAVWGVALSADGHLLASGGEDGTARLWETGSGRPVASLSGHTGAVYRVALSADGQLLASSGVDGTVRLWDTGAGLLLVTLMGHTGTVYRVALSADGQLLASSGEDGTLRLWETDAGRPLAVLHGHTGAVWGVAVSAGGQLLASGGVDRTVRLWETRTGRPRALLTGHTGAVWDVALSASGELVASSSYDGTVRVWAVSSGACLHVLRPERRYERMDISGLTGISPAQHTALLALGAVERPEPRRAARRADGAQPTLC